MVKQVFRKICHCDNCIVIYLFARNNTVLYVIALFVVVAHRGVVARRDTGRFPGGPLTRDFVKPKKIFQGNKFFGEIISHLYQNSSS